jgi:amino acid adenylation domain-containing protein
LRVERFLEDSARRAPDKIALISGSRRYTYRELDEAAARAGDLMRSHGLRRGDRVVICLDSSAAAVIAVFATLKAGAVFVPVHPSCKGKKLEYLLNDCHAAMVVCDGRRLRVLASLWDTTPALHTILVVGGDLQAAGSGKNVIAFESVVPGKRPATAQCGIDLDLAALVYTSGSTGQSKGVMLTHLNMVSAATSITTYLENTESDIILNVLPLSFDYGLYQVLMAFKVRATVVLEASFAYPQAVLETLVRERVTGLPIVPTMAALLLRMDLRRHDFSALRYITNTGAALPVQHVRELRTLLPAVRLYLMYGLTECKRVSYLPPDQVDVRPESVGRGMPNTEVYLVDEQGTRLDSGVGELVIRGSNVMKGYWNMPAESARVLKPGPLPDERVLYSGDIFRMDDDGYLYFVGRKDDIIKTRGEKVSPREVENVIHAMDGVDQAVVVGVPDPVLGQSVKALVTLRSDASLSANDVRRHCATHLEEFMVPSVVEFLPSMPTTSNGKVDRQLLQKLAIA